MFQTQSFIKDLAVKVRNSWRIVKLMAQYPGLTLKQTLDLFSLYFTEDLDLIVFWQISNTDIRGFHHVGGINLGLQPPLQLQARLGAKIQEAASKGEKTLMGGGRSLFAATAREGWPATNTEVNSVPSGICSARN